MPTEPMTAEETVCPVCRESIHGEKKVGVTTGCGHIWHQECYRSWKLKGEYTYESSTLSSDNSRKKRYTLDSHTNCLVCQQPTQSFVDLFIRLPKVTSSHKDLLTKLEHEFDVVSRQTQQSLEREIARRDFERTWLQEERLLSQAARDRAETRHQVAIQTLEDRLEELKVNYERKIITVDDKRRRRSGGSGTITLPPSPGGLQFRPNEHAPHDMDQSLSFSTLENFGLDSAAAESDEEVSAGEAENTITTHSRQSSHEQLAALATEDTNSYNESTVPQPSSILGPTVSSEANAMSWHEPSSLLSWDGEENATSDATLTIPFTNISPISAQETTSASVASRPPIGVDSTWEPTRTSAVARRSPIQADTSCLLDDSFPSRPPTPPTNTVNSLPLQRSISNDAISLAAVSQDNQPRDFDTMNSALVNVVNDETEDGKPPASRKRKGSLAAADEDDGATLISTTASIISVAEYERHRLEAETAYHQHQAELVELELHQAEIELERDEQVLRQREERIRMERSRLEESFSSIQRRVEESKQDARDSQVLTVIEQKFVKYKIARCREEERYEQELEHLKQEEVHIRERDKREKQRQETEKIKLKKELNHLIKVHEQWKLAKVAEEQSSASQSQDACVICFEALVNNDNELGVVECGHTFHSQCWDRWGKSNRRRGLSSVPCPLCNVPINNVCVTMRFGPFIYSSSTGALAKHFQKEESRWQRRRLTDFEMTGEVSS